MLKWLHQPWHNNRTIWAPGCQLHIISGLAMLVYEWQQEDTVFILYIRHLHVIKSFWLKTNYRVYLCCARISRDPSFFIGRNSEDRSRKSQIKMAQG